MAYAQQTWTDGAGGATPLSAPRLSYIENGIAAAATVADAANAAASAAQSQLNTVAATVATLTTGLAAAQQTIADLQGGGVSGGGGSRVVYGTSVDATNLLDGTLVVLLSADPTTV